MLTRLRLENFKSWQDTGDIALKPITGFFGPNSSGKTSLFQSLLLMKQSAELIYHGAMFHFGNEKTPVDLRDFRSVVYDHDTTRILKLRLGWQSSTEIEIPDHYAGGTVSQGDSIGFEVESQGDVTSQETSRTLDAMAYYIAGSRRFGVQRERDPLAYNVFARGPTFTDSRHLGRDDVGLHPTSFCSFPYSTRIPAQYQTFLSNLEYSMRLLLRNLYYLGPLRAFPQRLYVWSGASPPDVGRIGEYAVDSMLSSRELTHFGENGLDSRYQSIDEQIAVWLKRLGLVHDFRVGALAEDRRVFEVKVRKSPQSAEVLLTDIGFGVSQLLPVLALCFYAPQNSTVILEQPDMHLHPSVQAGLADVFIDACKSRGVQIMFESHSEHLLRRLQRRIAEGDIQEEDVGLYFCSTDDSGSSKISQLKFDQFGNISNWPKDFFGDQFGEIAAMSEAVLKRQGLSG